MNGGTGIRVYCLMLKWIGINGLDFDSVRPCVNVKRIFGWNCMEKSKIMATISSNRHIKMRALCMTNGQTFFGFCSFKKSLREK